MPPADVATLAEARRRNQFEPVPRELDGQLLSRARAAYGQTVPDEHRKKMREGFWAVIILNRTLPPDTP